jgi:hypothetical protein
MHVTRHLHPFIDFMAQLINHSSLSFEAQTKKSLQWFWGTNHQTVATDFDAQTGKPAATGFEAKLGETINLGFEVKPKNLHSSCSCAQCRPHTASPDISIVRPPSTWPVLDHPRSSAPGLLLLTQSSSLPVMLHLSPAHHETSKHYSPHKIDRNRTTEVSRIQIETEASQLLITYQTNVLTI